VISKYIKKQLDFYCDHWIKSDTAKNVICTICTNVYVADLQPTWSDIILLLLLHAFNGLFPGQPG